MPPPQHNLSYCSQHPVIEWQHCLDVAHGLRSRKPALWTMPTRVSKVFATLLWFCLLLSEQSAKTSLFSRIRGSLYVLSLPCYYFFPVCCRPTKQNYEAGRNTLVSPGAPLIPSLCLGWSTLCPPSCHPCSASGPFPVFCEHPCGAWWEAGFTPQRAVRSGASPKRTAVNQRW